MLTFVLGGAASGKSRFAESLFAGWTGPLTYIATLEPLDEESRRRVEKHRAQRAGKGFETVERYRDLGGLCLPEGGGALLECVGTLTANELFSPQGAGTRTAEAVLTGIDHLLRPCRELVVVSSEVFLGGQDYAGDTLRYLKILAEIHRGLALRAGRAVEMAAGLPLFHKGGPGL